MADRPNILVTGGAGFIGSHLCEALVNEANVICVDNFITSQVRNISHLLEYPNFRFINHDITTPFDLESFTELEDFNIKYKGLQQVYHLAAPTSVKRFEELMIETAQANSIGTKNALDVALKYKASFLFTSSAVVYGNVQKDVEFIPEDYKGVVDHLTPRSAYDEGKRFAETLVHSYRLKHQLDTKIVRIFRAYGPRMALQDGQVVSDYVVDALDNKDLVIYGDENFSTTLCFVSDIIDGMLKVMTTDAGDAEIVNLGSDNAHALVDVAKQIIEMTKSKSGTRFETPPLFLTQLGVPDLSFAKQNYAWLPVVGLEDGLQQTIDYIKAERGVMHIS